MTAVRLRAARGDRGQDPGPGPRARFGERLEESGAVLRAPEHDESNALYDDAERKLSGSGRTVRLRRAAGRTILTYKGPARFEGGAKVREEREVDVSDAGEAEAILAGLGLSAAAFATTSGARSGTATGCVVALDTTPIGTFVEIEGDPPAIRKLIVRLDLDFTEAIPYSYAELYQRRRKEDPALPPDMVWTA